MKFLRSWNRRKLIFGLLLLGLTLMIWYQPVSDEVVGSNADDADALYSYTTITIQSIDEWLEIINENLITKPAPTEPLDPEEVLNKGMEHLGLESVDLHEFKSVYIRDPKIYHPDLTPRVPGIRKPKVISCYSCPRWYRSFDFTASYNRQFKVCPYSECQFDSTGRKHKEAAMVMFFPSHYPSNMPPKSPGQVWVNAKWEPTPYDIVRSDKDYGKFRVSFNWTAGYSRDDDLFWPMNLLGWRARNKLLSDDHYIRMAKGMNKTVMWWTSTRCQAHSKRQNYIKELQKYIEVDSYGQCGNIACKTWTDCNGLLNGTYKFYLSFENSFCKDYVTDEFFRTFANRRFIIPVVRGGLEYEKFFPPRTFINANNFKNPKELALYLKQLANDIPAYANYLKEKDKLTVLNYKNDWCDLCEMLHTNVKKKTIPDLHAVTHAKDLCWTKDNNF